MNEMVIQNALEMILDGDCDVCDTAFEELVSVVGLMAAMIKPPEIPQMRS